MRARECMEGAAGTDLKHDEGAERSDSAFVLDVSTTGRKKRSTEVERMAAAGEDR